ncbi:hypothetical protein ABT173_20975 [Streptomyces sp. NPDC001795]|uniref:hypothetical protein n=1 Tax=unclassified Streptomyces TaxID=2593676 RepID=UPI00332EBF28
MTAPQDPRRHFALPSPADTDPQDGSAITEVTEVTDESTVRLPHPDQLDTVRLDDPATAQEPAVTLRLPEHGVPEVVPTTAVTGPEIRFGPGVPAAVRTGATAGSAAEVWHGTARPEGPPPGDERRRRRRRGRLLGGWLLPLAVLIAVLGYLAWQRYGPPLAVTGASVHTDPGGPGCDGTAAITGTLRTNGRAGDVSYRWKRSDGTVSDTLHQQIARGTRHPDVVLRWTFNGHGTMRATATLEVLSPDPVTASATFTYRCR